MDITYKISSDSLFELPNICEGRLPTLLRASKVVPITRIVGALLIANNTKPGSSIAAEERGIARIDRCQEMSYLISTCSVDLGILELSVEPFITKPMRKVCLMAVCCQP